MAELVQFYYAEIDGHYPSRRRNSCSGGSVLGGKPEPLALKLQAAKRSYGAVGLGNFRNVRHSRTKVGA